MCLLRVLLALDIVAAAAAADDGVAGPLVLDDECQHGGGLEEGCGVEALQFLARALREPVEVDLLDAKASSVVWGNPMRASEMSDHLPVSIKLEQGEVSRNTTRVNDSANETGGDNSSHDRGNVSGNESGTTAAEEEAPRQNATEDAGSGGVAAGRPKGHEAKGHGTGAKKTHKTKKKHGGHHRHAHAQRRREKVKKKKKKPKAKKKTIAGADEQCGGGDYKGPTKCVGGYFCYFQDKWFGQCKPKGFRGDWVLYDAGDELNSTSEAPLMTFYMYRAQGEKEYPLTNVNTGTLAGTMWYLHNEVVSCTYNHDCMRSRRFGIDRISRFKVQTRATSPLFELGLNFGIRYAFDSGRCTGPWNCEEQFNRLGYFVGCNNLNDGFPFPTWTVYYSGAVWFSLPGSCEEKEYNLQAPMCKEDQPGGLCDAGPPDGTGTCTYAYEEAGEISIDELENLTDYASFKDLGGKEYDPYADAGVDMSFWDNINSTEANDERVAKADALFKSRFPDLPADGELPPPPCDFDMEKFFG